MRNIFTKIKLILISDIFFAFISILYVITIIGVLYREFKISDFRATDQFIVLLGLLFIPIFLILALVYVTRNYNVRKLIESTIGTS